MKKLIFDSGVHSFGTHNSPFMLIYENEAMEGQLLYELHLVEKDHHQTGFVIFDVKTQQPVPMYFDEPQDAIKAIKKFHLFEISEDLFQESSQFQAECYFTFKDAIDALKKFHSSEQAKEGKSFACYFPDDSDFF